MKKLKFLKKQFTPERSLIKQISWLPNYFERSLKKKNSSLRIALISDERVYSSLCFEGEVIILTEDNWHWVLRYAEVDLVLIESCTNTITGDWFMSQTEERYKSGAFSQLLNEIELRSIPLAYWLTLDQEYLPQYEKLICRIGRAFCADNRAVEKLSKKGVDSYYLPPAVQPALFSKLAKFSSKRKDVNTLVCDDLVGVIQSKNEKHRMFQLDIENFGGVFYDSRNQVWFSKTKDLPFQRGSILGTVDFKTKVELFRSSKCLAILKSESRTLTDMKWSVVEASASHMTIIKDKSIELDEFESLSFSPVESGSEILELISYEEEPLYQQMKAHKGWRKVLMQHTFSHRIKKICDLLNIRHDWVEYPTAAMISPSYRNYYLERARESFIRQTYPNKKWVLVFNGPPNEFSKVESEINELEFSKAIYVPQELHAGPCMNAGISSCGAEYAFRMDDDDYYGENYLLDMMLYQRVMDYDVIGKSFRAFVIKEKYPNSVFYRTADVLNFQRPSYCEAESLPTNMNYLAGCTQGGKTTFLQNNPYPEANFGSVDSQWLDGLREQNTGLIMCVDDFNLVVDRRLSGDHTWHTAMDNFIKNSKEYKNASEEFMFV